MSPRRIRRTILWLALAALAAGLLPPFINANRFRNQLANTISRSIGRPVQMGDVHFQLVPQPGFVLKNLAIGDDPNFSSEPVLRADSVTASLRLTSLWRGRLEISKLTFDTPSLNLVRATNGHWNVESVLQQASQVPAAPTARVKPEQRPRFPYIEASNGRINFRVGQEKRPHVLMDADFALWLESEDQWNMRLEARPTRTDAYLSDTGTIQLTGWFRRGDTLANTRMKLDAHAEKAQLGQWTSLLLGSDRGWRGGVEFEAHAAGSVTDFDFQAKSSVRDFHRHDVANPDTLDASADCTGKVTVPPGAPAPVVGLQCSSKSFGGTVSVAGDIAAHQRPGFNLHVVVREVAVDALVDVFRHVKKDVPADLSGEGTFGGEYHFARPFGGVTTATGSGEVAGMTLASEARSTSLSFPTFDVEFLPPKRKGMVASNELTVGNSGIRLGGTALLYVSAKVSPTEVNVRAKGDVELPQLTAAASLFGLADPRYRFSGSATVDLNVRGTYADFAAPVITGNAQIRDLRTQVDGVAAPLLLQSARLEIGAEKIALQKISARLEGTNTVAEGVIEMPRSCPEDGCRPSFALKAAQVDLDEFNRALNPRYRSSDWLSAPLRFLEGRPVKASRLMMLRAAGKISVGKLKVKNLQASNVTAGLVFDKGKIALTDLRGVVLGGRHSGTWNADLTKPEPEYRGQGSVEGLALTQVNALLHVPAGSGTAVLSYELALRGADAAALRKSAAGSAQFRWTNGAWRTMQFANWSGKLSVGSGEVQVEPSVMQTRNGPYRVSGRVGFDRTLDLKLDGRKDQLLVTGTVQDLKVAVQAAEQLASPESASNLKNARPIKVQN